MAHTPGPLWVVPGGPGKYFVVADATDVHGVIVDGEYTVVARGCTAADAALFAAAPDLLAALRQLIADWDAVPESLSVPDAINENDHWAAARAAIAKATQGE